MGGRGGYGDGFRRVDRENYANIQSRATRNSALKPLMTPSAATKSTFLATILILAWQHAAKAQMAGTTIKCNNGTMLRVISKKEYLTTFQYGNAKFTLADTTPHGATFSVYGDTQSPAGTGISFSNHGIGGQIKGKEFTCK